MKYLLLIIMIICISLSTNAQKKDKETIGRIEFVQYPENPLNLEYKTYKIIAKSSDPYRRDDIINRSSLDGYEKTDSEQETDLVIEIEEYPRQSTEIKISTRKTKVKKDGIESTVTTYYAVNSFKYKYTYKLSDANGVIFETAYQGDKKVTGADGKNYTEAEANHSKALASEKNSILTNAITSLNASSNDLYGYPVHSIYLYAYKIKPKKYNYDEFNDAWSKIKSSVDQSNTSNQDVETFQEDLKNAIAVYNKELEQLDLNNKKARVNADVGAAAYYNACLSYFLLKEYDKALDCLNQGRAIDNGIGNANIMEAILTKMSSRAKIHKEHLAAN